MRKMLLFITLMLATGLTLAQPGSPFFTTRANSDSQETINRTAPPVIDPNAPSSPNVELEVVIAESFFRRIWSGINNKDEIRKQMTYARFSLNDQQASVLQQSIYDWMNLTSADALARQDQMCAYWNSQSGGSDSLVIADAALELYDSLEPDKERTEERLQILIEDIELKLGEDFVISLMSELDKDYELRKGLKYTSFASSVRGRNNTIEQLQFTCGGE